MAAVVPPSVPIGCEPRTLPLRAVALGRVRAGAANGSARRRGERSGACARGPGGKQIRSVCGALAAVRARGGVA